MNITSKEITWGAFKFHRTTVEGFYHEKEHFYIFLKSNQKIKLGYEVNPWPFFHSVQNNQPKLSHLTYDRYRFLPEHVFGYHDDKNQESILVWTAFGELTIPRALPQTVTQMQVPAGFENSTANDWMNAYNWHKNNPFSV